MGTCGAPFSLTTLHAAQVHRSASPRSLSWLSRAPGSKPPGVALPLSVVADESSDWQTLCSDHRFGNLLFFFDFPPLFSIGCIASRTLFFANLDMNGLLYRPRPTRAIACTSPRGYDVIDCGNRKVRKHLPSPPPRNGSIERKRKASCAPPVCSPPATDLLSEPRPGRADC
jgi:hypothetical protein